MAWDVVKDGLARQSGFSSMIYFGQKQHTIKVKATTGFWSAVFDLVAPDEFAQNCLDATMTKVTLLNTKNSA